GKRIAKAYYERAENKKEALITLINLKDANAIYRASKYNP
ncbi:lytic murein transglycosylase, partial [Pseudoalteromonas ruthenica]